MREIGTIPDREAAERLANYLLTQGIATRLDQEQTGWVVWVRDEDQLQRARDELERFLRNPEEPCYRNAAAAAEAHRRQETHREKQYRKNYHDVRRQWDRLTIHGRPVTFAVITVCLAIAVVTGFGYGNERWLNKLVISSYYIPGPNGETLPCWKQIRSGELWRLITPAFTHEGVPHIVFNLWGWYLLASMVELAQGTWRLALFVVVVAVTVNVGDYAFTGVPAVGLSGVVFGLFGYVWMKSRFDLDAGMYIGPQSVIIMIIWFFLCLTGVIPNVANTGHFIGLALGVIAGYAPILWRNLKSAL